MTPFEIAEPASLDEALGLLDPDDPSVRPFAGGTALMLLMRTGLYRPTRFVSLRGIADGLTGMEAAGNGTLKIGAMTTLSALERSDAVRKHAPVITRTLRTLSNVRVRNVATVGGHLSHADPHMDLPPVLCVLGATATVAGPNGARDVPVGELATGYLETVLAGNELITQVTVPPVNGAGIAYVKCTTRSADDWPALGVAVRLSADGGNIHDARVVVSAATERPTRLASAEGALNEGEASDTVHKQAGEAAADEVAVEDDAFGSADYKRQLVRVHVARAARQALDAAGAAG